MSRNVLFYFAVLSVFGIGTYLVLDAGERLRPGAVVEKIRGEAVPAAAGAERQPARGASAVMYENSRHPLGTLLLQLVVVLVTARAFGALFRRLKQPAVVGEMLAGIALGPSLLGALVPGTQVFLFPAQSLGPLELLSQVGVVLFMFVVGMDLDVGHLRRKAHATVVISHASIVAPFFLGVAFSLVIYPQLAPPGVPFSAFALFMGVAMSVTAFPVLARIVEERGLCGTYVGTTAIACAAVDDATAWCALAFVAVLAKAGGVGGALLTTLLALLLAGAMLFLLKPLVERLSGAWARGAAAGRGGLARALLLLFGSAMVTEAIGVHVLFGAFLAGVVMPSGEPPKAVRERLESFSSALLLPLFFAFTGLRTQVGLLDDCRSWLICGAVVAVAIAGKLGGGALAGRWTGMSWRESFSVGALLNTRGLVELVVLNLGYDLGILSPKVFAMMVLMALATTCMTGPLLSLSESWGRGRPFPAEANVATPASKSFRDGVAI